MYKKLHLLKWCVYGGEKIPPDECARNLICWNEWMMCIWWRTNPLRWMCKKLHLLKWMNEVYMVEDYNPPGWMCKKLHLLNEWMMCVWRRTNSTRWMFMKLHLLKLMNDVSMVEDYNPLDECSRNSICWMNEWCVYGGGLIPLHECSRNSICWNEWMMCIWWRTIIP